MILVGPNEETVPVDDASASGVRLKTDIVVIGAGQAGLSTAYHLKRRGLPPIRGFVVLDQSPNAGGAWQFRWPSLTLSTVNRIHDLPGMPFADVVDTTATEVTPRTRRRSTCPSIGP
jgi:cation diffusion facilitator CzcD-associated flavoprotein CzcO